MSEVRASFVVGEFELAFAARRRRGAIGGAGCGDRLARAVEARLRPRVGVAVPTVRDFTVSPARRLADAVASAAIVRDVAALGALVLFATMLAVVLSSGVFLV